MNAPALSYDHRRIVGKRKTGIQDLLVWAIRDQKADLYANGNTMLFEIESAAMGRPVDRISADGCYTAGQYGALGCYIDSSVRVTRTTGDVHPDAEAVYETLRAQPDDLIVGLAIRCARAGSEPDWRPNARHRFVPDQWQAGTDEPEGVEMRMRAYDAIEALHPRRIPLVPGTIAMIERSRQENRPGDPLLTWVKAVKVREVDDAAAIALARSMYTRWARMLDALARTLRRQAACLVAHEVSADVPHAEPWLDDELVRRALLSLQYAVSSKPVDFNGYP